MKNYNKPTKLEMETLPFVSRNRIFSSWEATSRRDSWLNLLGLPDLEFLMGLRLAYLVALSKEINLLLDLGIIVGHSSLSSCKMA